MYPVRAIAILALLAPLLLCASCDTRTQPPPKRPSAVENDPFVKLAPAPVDEPAEPDWKARHDTLKSSLLNTFGAPRIGKALTIKLKSGTEREGTLTALSDSEATLAFDVGEVSYPRAALSAQSRAELFAEDYAQARATELIQRDREAYRRKKSVQARSAATASGVASGPVNDPDDESVWQVKAYLEETLKDPQTIRYVEWSPVMKTDRGFQVVCTYQARAGSFGMVTEKKVFHMTRSGDVTAASAVRRNLEK